MFRYVVRQRSAFLDTWIDLDDCRTLDEALRFQDEWVEVSRPARPDIALDVRVSRIRRAVRCREFRDRGDAV